MTTKEKLQILLREYDALRLAAHELEKQGGLLDDISADAYYAHKREMEAVAHDLKLLHARIQSLKRQVIDESGDVGKNVVEDGVDIEDLAFGPRKK